MIKIELFQNFRKEFKKLHKKNRNIVDYLQNLEKELLKNPTTGTFLSDNIYKIRVANSSKNIGKRGGFRVITYFVDEDKTVYLVNIYEKNTIENISIETIKSIIKNEL